MKNIKVRQLFSEDWQFAKSIRLLALRQNPDVYLSNYEKEAKYDDAKWRQQLSISDGATFGLFDNQQVIGLTGVFTWRGDAANKTAIFCMSFIDKAYRGKGYSKLLYEARLRWVTQQNTFEKIRVSHRAGNEASQAANQAFGFKLTDKKIVTWPDAVQDFEYNYELDLRR